MKRPPRATRTSDVTRFRGIAIASLVAAVVVAAAALFLSSAAARRGMPGPLSRPHQAKAIACATCHTEGTHRKPAAAVCVGCHQAHPSTRAGHRDLVARGALGCITCHPAHHDNGTVRFFPDGHAVRHDGRGDRTIAAGRFRPVAAIEVPLVAASACAHCHDIRSPRDPAAACLIAGTDVCFDEHAPLRAAGGQLAVRSAAWGAARAVAIAAPARRPPTGGGAAPWVWLAAGIVAAALTAAVARARDRRRRPTPLDIAPDEPPSKTEHARGDPVAIPLRLPVIDTATCLGCHACVEACPYDVLEIHRYVAVLARPTDCCGLTLCAQKCPNGSLTMRAPDAHGHADAPTSAAPALTATLELRELPGLYLAGDATGHSLIRNAIDQGARVAIHVAERLAASAAARTRAGDDVLDLVIIGAGPAGLSAALEARARNLRALTIEQSTVAGSIRSFPRGKLVIDSERPIAGRLWLAEATKEELLARWMLAIRQAEPAILEGRRVTAITRAAPSGYNISAIDADGRTSTRRAAHVLVAIGRRGSPRRLAIDVPPAMLDHVHYSLADARSFAGRRVLVVGLGDVAMEAALALSRQPDTQVTIAARAADFRRGKARNIDEVRRRTAAGALQVVWQAEVTGLAPGRGVLTTPAGPVEVGCDSVFVLIGSIAPETDLIAGLRATLQTDHTPRTLEPESDVRPARREESPS